jgi:hypothetical protein
MDFDGEGFKEFSRTQGKLHVESDGEVQEKDYSAVNYINAAGTIGYSEVTVEGKPDSIFVSKTVDGIVLTMPGEQGGPAPFPVEGYLTLTIVASGSGPKAFYEAHVQAIGEEPLLSDRAWLEHEVPTLGQRALDVMMKIFAQVVKQMDEMMSGLGNAMGQMMEGMGKAMGEAMDGVGKAMGEALGGAAEENAPMKAALAPPELAVRPKAPAKKAKPARKSAPKKKAKPKAAPKMKAKPKATPKKKPARKAAPKKKTKTARKAKAPARKPKKKDGKKRK